MKLAHIVLAMGFCFTNGCYVSTERSVVGTYKALVPCETLILVLKPDHTVFHQIRKASGESAELYGSWKLSSAGWLMFSWLPSSSQSALAGQDIGGGPVERWPAGKVIGPVMSRCGATGYKVDYVQRWGDN